MLKNTRELVHFGLFSIHLSLVCSCLKIHNLFAWIRSLRDSVAIKLRVRLVGI
jgi:hypothetical protein